MKKLLILLLAILVNGAARAQLGHGKVYNFENVAYSGKSMSLATSDLVGITNKNNADYSQLWYVEEIGSTYTLRNLMSGQYLRSSNGTSAKWTMVNDVDDNCKFNCYTAGSGHTLRASNTTDSYHYMHLAASQGNNVVGWEMNAGASQWTITEVSISASDLQANWDKVAEFNPNTTQIQNYKNSLAVIFSDKACTKLNATYASMSEATLKSNSHFLALSKTLQDMVLKVKAGDWSENNAVAGKQGWNDEYAQRFRVQLYEPYNNPGDAASVLRINAHTNLNNPTGIYANNRQALYIMVEGQIEDGAELYLASWTGHGKPGNDHRAGVRLYEGLNVVPFYTDNTATCINYVVNTFDTSKSGMDARLRKLSDYDNLKIHIEGGHITGYYNKLGDALWGEGDNAADWDYCAARANQTDLTVLGKYITLQFPLKDADTEGNKGMDYYLTGKNNVESIIDEWDNIMLWERLVMGLLDQTTIEANAKKSPYSDRPYVFEYSDNDTDAFGSDYADYYNVHGLSFGVGGSSYMYGSWDHCGYHYNTMSSVIQDLPNGAGVHWGPGHEIGHQHQGPLNMNGLTEVTNNLFANVVLWYYGETTSRVNGTEGSLSNVLAAYNTEGSDFYTNNIWALTHMYYKLFLYYHVLGKNTKFYPRLFEMLRKDPMQIAYEQSGVTSLLHFYKKCCMAAGEDLTEFFRAYGFFRVMDNRLVGDYSNSVYTQTQEEIDAAIAEVKALNYAENHSVLFINDATGETIKSHKGDDLELYGETTVCAEVGSYASYSNATAPQYTYAYDGETITMNGTGGVGFAIYNEKGEIIAFSDKKNFTISDETALLLTSEKATIAIVDADGSHVEATNLVDACGEDQLRTMLETLLDNALKIVALKDETGKKVGYYKAASIQSLEQACGVAKDIYDAYAVASYQPVYKMLQMEMAKVLADADAQIVLTEGNAYRLVNYAYKDRSMSIDSKNIVIGEITNNASDAQMWYFEASSEMGKWFVKNKSTRTYAKSISTSQPLDASAATTSEAAAYQLRSLGDGLFALVENNGMHCASSQSYNVVGWGVDASATQWYITAVEVDEEAILRKDLQKLMEQTEELIDEMGDVSEQKLALTESDYKSNAECKNTTYGDQFTSYSVLCDNNTNTFFHSDYSNQAPKEYHYIRMDVGSGQELMKFKMHYTTRGSGNVCAPTSVVIEGSNNDSDWTELMAVNSGLPTSNNASHTFDVLGDGNAYRYVRIVVKTTNGGQDANGYQYFAMSELGLSKFVATPVAEYASLAQKLQSTHDVLAYLKETVAVDATKDQCTTAYNTLKAKYDALAEAKKTVDNAPLVAKKAELKELIDLTKNLVDRCGSISYMDEGALKLQTTNENGAFYLSTNAPEPTEGPIENLVDGDNNTYFHSAWSVDVNQVHHLMVKVADVDITNSFNFTYFCQRGPFPYEIKVYGATDKNGAFELIKTFSKDDATNALPTTANVNWTSDDVVPAKAYRYLRFDVTNSGADGIDANPKGEYCFAMSEFGVAITEDYSVKLNGVGSVTKEQLVDAYVQNQKAEGIYNYSVFLSDVEDALAELTAKYEVLYEAANTYKVTVSSAGYASFYAPVALTLPEGLTAYAVKTVNGKAATLEEMDGIAANQGAILRGESKTYSLTVGVVESDWNGNLLKGSAANTYVEGEAYVLAVKDGKVGMYKTALNKNASGGAGTTHFLNNAGKAYLPASVIVSSARFLVFNFGTETGIVETENGNMNTENVETFDLSGRRVENAKKGIFIVNGKKVIK